MTIRILWNYNKNKKAQVQNNKNVRKPELNQTEEVQLYGNKQQI